MLKEIVMKKKLLLIFLLFLFQTNCFLCSEVNDKKSKNQLVESIILKDTNRQKNFSELISAFIRLCMKGDLEGVKYIYETCYPHKKLLDYLTRIYVNQNFLEDIVRERGFDEIANIFEVMKKGSADIDDCEYSLVHAAKEKNYEQVLLLLKQRVDVYKTNDFSERTALHYLIFSKEKDIVKTLLQYSKEGIDKQDLLGHTALFIAVSLGSDDIVEILLDYGANPNIVSINRITPLHVAAMYGYENIVEQLLIHGVDIDLKDLYGCTATGIAHDMGHIGIKNYLILAKWGLGIYEKSCV